APPTDKVEREAQKTHPSRSVAHAGPNAARNLKGDTTHASPSLSYGPFWRRFRTHPRDKFIRSLMGSVKQWDDDIPVLVSNLAKCKTQRITAHLWEGLKLVSQATSMERDTAAQVSTSEAALAEFRKAVALDEKDLDALEHAARQARRLNFHIEMQ